MEKFPFAYTAKRCAVKKWFYLVMFVYIKTTMNFIWLNCDGGEYSLPWQHINLFVPWLVLVMHRCLYRLYFVVHLMLWLSQTLSTLAIAAVAVLMWISVVELTSLGEGDSQVLIFLSHVQITKQNWSRCLCFSALLKCIIVKLVLCWVVGSSLG